MSAIDTFKMLAKGVPKLYVELNSFVFEIYTLVPILLNDLRTGKIRRGNGRSIMILPGFTATDGSLIVLYAVLKMLGFDVHTWGQGRNHGRFHELWPGILQQIEAIRKKNGNQPIELIGWSKGGRIARKVAEILGPDYISGIVTIGTPAWGNTTRSVEDVDKAWPERLFPEFRQDVIDIINELKTSVELPSEDIPTSVIVGSLDQVVSGKDALMPEDDLHKNLQNVIIRFCGHLALGFSARTIRAIVNHILDDLDRYDESHYAVAA